MDSLEETPKPPVTVAEAGRKGGKAKTERKAESSRRNGMLGGSSPRPLVDISCTCGRGDSENIGEGHPTTCPRGRAIRRRKEKGQPLQ